MKIGLTGHTSGLGLNITSRFSKSYDFKYFSRKNGYDIKENDKILSNLDDCDIFINNAYNSKYQSELLLKWFNKYKNTNKHIINIGSRDLFFFDKKPEPNEYSLNKKLLQSYTRQLQYTHNRKCKITLLNPSYISYNEEKTEKSINKNDILDLIEFIISKPNLEFQDILFRGFNYE